MTAADQPAGSRGRRTWSLVDQGLSSATNFVMTLLVARLVSKEAFGVFALVYGLSLIAVGGSRGLVANPFMVRFTDAPTAAVERAHRAAGGALLALGGCGSLLLVVAAVVLGGSLLAPLLALAAALPLLLLQDGIRFLFFARGTPRDAVVSDAVWALVQFSSLAILAVNGSLTATTALMAWGLGASAGAVVGASRADLVPSLRAAPSWFRDHRDIGLPFAGENVVKVGSRYVVLTTLAAVIGVAAVGSIRGGEEVLGVMRPLLVALPLVGIPEGVRLLAGGKEKLSRACWLLTGVLVLMVGSWAALMLVFGERLGPLVLGETWPGASTVILPLAIANVVSAAGIPPSFGLRVLADARRSLRTRVAASVGLLLLGGVGAAVGGVQGAAVGIVAAETAGTALWWWMFHRSLRSPSPPPPVDTAVTASGRVDDERPPAVARTPRPELDRP